MPPRALPSMALRMFSIAHSPVSDGVARCGPVADERLDCVMLLAIDLMQHYDELNLMNLADTAVRVELKRHLGVFSPNCLTWSANSTSHASSGAAEHATDVHPARSRPTMLLHAPWKPRTCSTLNVACESRSHNVSSGLSYAGPRRKGLIQGTDFRKIEHHRVQKLITQHRGRTKNACNGGVNNGKLFAAEISS